MHHLSVRVRTFTALGYALPLGLFFYYLYKFAYNSPEADDYFAIFGFLNDFFAAKSWKEQFTVAFGLIGEHRIVFSRMLYLLTTWIDGEIDLRAFIWIGNLVYLGLIPMLYLVFRPSPQRFVYFLPVPFLILQQQYSEITFSAVCSTQHNVVFFFALLTVYSLHQPGKRAFLWACLGGLVATFTNGNGFLALLAGLGMLLFTQRWAKAGAWLVPLVVITALYFIDFQGRGGDGALAYLLANPLKVSAFSLKFIGSAANVGRWGYELSIVLGSLLALYFGSLLLGGYARKNPVLFGFLVFLALTTVATALSRASMGYAYRYNIYSAIFLVIFYISLFDIWPKKSTWIFWSGLTLSFLFWAFSYFDYTDFILTIRREKTANVYNLSVNGFGLMDRYYSGKYVNSGIHFKHDGLLKLAKSGYYHFPEPDLSRIKAALAQPRPSAQPLLTATLVGRELSVASTSYFQPTEETWITLQQGDRIYLLTAAQHKNRFLAFLRSGQYVGPQVTSTLFPNSLPPGQYRLGVLARAGSGFTHQDGGITQEIPQ